MGEEAELSCCVVSLLFAGSDGVRQLSSSLSLLLLLLLLLVSALSSNVSGAANSSNCRSTSAVEWWQQCW